MMKTCIMCTAPFSVCILPQLIGLARPTFLISCLVFQLFLREIQCNPNCLSGYVCLGATFYDVPFTHKPVMRHQLETVQGWEDKKYGRPQCIWLHLQKICGQLDVEDLVMFPQLPWQN